MKQHKVRARCCAFLLLIASGAVMPSLAQDPRSALPILSQSQALTNAASPDPLPEGTEVPWTWQYTHQSTTKFVRLHLRVRGLPDDASWYLIIRDGDENTVERLTAASFHWLPADPNQPAEADRWTQRVRGKKVIVELHVSSTARNLRVFVDQVNYSFFKPGQKAFTTGSNDMRDLVEAVTRTHRYYDFGRSIAFIRLLMSDESGRETNCTGFLLAPDLVMTNQHCISEPWQLDTAKAIFGYESHQSFELEQDTILFDRIEMQDLALDFTVLHLKWPARSNWRPAKFNTAQVTKDQKLILIQHPDEQRKVLSVIDCLVQSVSVTDRPQYPNDFYHLCDCAGGSSGSPVIDEATGKVVGLHHRGVEAAFKRGINLAVKIGVILEKIRTSNEALYNRIMQNP